MLDPRWIIVLAVLATLALLVTAVVAVVVLASRGSRPAAEPAPIEEQRPAKAPAAKAPQPKAAEPSKPAEKPKVQPPLTDAEKEEHFRQLWAGKGLPNLEEKGNQPESRGKPAAKPPAKTQKRRKAAPRNRDPAARPTRKREARPVGQARRQTLLKTRAGGRPHSGATEGTSRHRTCRPAAPPRDGMPPPMQC